MLYKGLGYVISKVIFVFKILRSDAFALGEQS